MAANVSNLPEANLRMVRAGIAALEKVRRTGAATKDNGDANIAYAIYNAMRAAACENGGIKSRGLDCRVRRQLR
jgi:hypothetical protein